MKKTFLIISIAITISTILYGIFAFATWELNPKNWDAFLRGMFAIFSIVISFFCGIGVYYEIED